MEQKRAYETARTPKLPDVRPEMRGHVSRATQTRRSKGTEYPCMSAWRLHASSNAPAPSTDDNDDADDDDDDEDDDDEEEEEEEEWNAEEEGGVNTRSSR